MQLKRIHLENFQSIREATTIDVAPTTLLYGPNSSGKSAVADALTLMAHLFSSEAPSELISRWTGPVSDQMKVGIGYQVKADTDLRYILKLLSLNHLITNDLTYTDYEAIEKGLGHAYSVFNSDEKNNENKWLRTGKDIEIDIIVTIDKYPREPEPQIERTILNIDGYPLITISKYGRLVELHLDHPKCERRTSLSYAVRDLNDDATEFAENDQYTHKMWVQNTDKVIRFRYLFEPFLLCGFRYSFSRNNNGASHLDYPFNIEDYADETAEIKGLFEIFLEDDGSYLDPRYEAIAPLEKNNDELEKIRWNLNGLFIYPVQIAGAMLNSMLRVGPIRTVPTHTDLEWRTDKSFTLGHFDDPYWTTPDSERVGETSIGKLLPIERTNKTEVGWYDGSAAWQYLAFSKNYELAIILINKLLSSGIGIDIGYEIIRQNYLATFEPEKRWVEGVVQKNGKWQSGEWLPIDEIASPVGNIGGRLNKYLRILFIYDQKRKVATSIEDVGCGVSQIIPVLCAIIKNKLVTFIEQPELHLHPKAQSQLGDLFLIKDLKILAHKDFKEEDYVFSEYEDRNYISWLTSVRFIETHSENIALRILRRIKENNDMDNSRNLHEKVNFYYFQPTDNGTKIHKIRIDSSGRFVDQWPEGFFDERIQELFS